MELFQNQLILIRLWTYFWPMMTCPMGKQFHYGINILKLGFHCVDYGLIFFTLWTYVFPMMAYTMGKTIPLWGQYFAVGIPLC